MNAAVVHFYQINRSLESQKPTHPTILNKNASVVAYSVKHYCITNFGIHLNFEVVCCND